MAKSSATTQTKSAKAPKITAGAGSGVGRAQIAAATKASLKKGK